jgi:sulfur-oxidizing protein SoxA
VPDQINKLNQQFTYFCFVGNCWAWATRDETAYAKLLILLRLWLSLWRNAVVFFTLFSVTLSGMAQQTMPPKSGITYAGADIRALQADDFANPGMLWVTRGEKLWNTAAGSSGKSCASCHQDAAVSMRGVSARYPRVDAKVGKLINIEGRINTCREQNQEAEPLRYETEELLALTSYVAHQSRGMKIAVVDDATTRPYLEHGREIYFRRQGQINLNCAHCHVQNAGRKLLAETISEGHGNGYPTYRLEWQSIGSLHRRLRACYYGVRAAMPAFGSDELLDLELYLARRGTGLTVETPAVRR